MTDDFSGKVVAITGGANGIGAAMARALAARGAQVAIGDLDGQKARALAQELGGVSARVDVGCEREVCAFISRAERALGPLDGYISNAGLGVSDAPTWHAGGAPNDAWELCWRVNVMASVFAARHKAMDLAARDGFFVVVASAAGLLNQIGDAAYSATKHAAVSFAETLAITHGDAGLRVHCLCPEGVRTNLVKGIEHGSQGLSGYIEPEDVAAALITAIEEQRFLVLTHPQTLEYATKRVTEKDRWLGGMRKLRRMLVEQHGRPF